MPASATRRGISRAAAAGSTRGCGFQPDLQSAIAVPMSAAAPHPVERLAEEDTLSLAERAYRRLRDSIVQGALAAGSRISERSLRHRPRHLRPAGAGGAAPAGTGRHGGHPAPARHGGRRIRPRPAGRDGPHPRRPRRRRRGAGRRAGRRCGAGGAGRAVAGDAGCDGGGEARAGLGGQRTLPRPDPQGDRERLPDPLARRACGPTTISAASARLGATPKELPRALREHAGILAALQARDPDTAETRMRAHVLRSLEVGGLLPPALPSAPRKRPA